MAKGIEVSMQEGVPLENSNEARTLLSKDTGTEDDYSYIDDEVYGLKRKFFSEESETLAIGPEQIVKEVAKLGQETLGSNEMRGLLKSVIRILIDRSSLPLEQRKKFISPNVSVYTMC